MRIDSTKTQRDVLRSPQFRRTLPESIQNQEQKSYYSEQKQTIPAENPWANHNGQPKPAQEYMQIDQYQVVLKKDSVEQFDNQNLNRHLQAGMKSTLSGTHTTGINSAVRHS